MQKLSLDRILSTERRTDELSYLHTTTTTSLVVQMLLYYSLFRHYKHTLLYQHQYCCLFNEHTRMGIITPGTTGDGTGCSLIIGLFP